MTRLFFLVLVTLFAILLAGSGYGSLSLYYTSGTTFINLRKPSRRSSVTFEYEQHGELSQRTLSSLQTSLGSKSMKRDGENVVFEQTLLGGGNVILSHNLLSTPLFSSPNGERIHQGWIRTKDDYYTKSQEVGDENILIGIQKALDESPVTITGIRVNVEVPDVSPIFLRDLLINIARPENRKDMVEENQVIPQKPFSIGFVEKLMQQKGGFLTYEPTMDELYDDFIVRQITSSIVNIGKKAWSMGVDECREIILASNSTSYPSYPIDLTSILVAHKPDDPISKLLGVTPSSTVQFREFSGEIQTAVRRAVGLVKATEIYGVFIADSLLSQVSYVEKTVITQIRERVMNDEDVVYKYITWDPESCGHCRRSKTEKVKKIYAKNDVVLGFMQNNQHGIVPLIIPGESVMWHQRIEHRFSIMAKYNPALINFNIIQLIYNKYFEWKLYDQYCKGTFAKSEHLMNILPPGTSPHNITIDLFVQSCNKYFPNGWVAKGIWDWNSGQNILHHKVDYHGIMDAYRNSSFAKYASTIQKHNSGCEPKEDLYSVLRTSPYFLAWKLDQFLADGRDGVVQGFVTKHSEYRVEGYAGRFPLSNTLGDDLKGNQFKKRVNGLFKQCNNKFPVLLRATALSSDVALLSDLKTISIFETNPGGNCYLIHHDKNLLQKHNKFLKKYKDIRKLKDPSQEGLDPEAQMAVIDDFMKQWGTYPLEKWERHFVVLPDRLLDDQVYATTVDMKKINTTKPQEYAPPALITLGRRYKILRKGLDDLSKGLKDPSDYMNDGLYEFIYGLQLMKESLSPEVSSNMKKSVDISAEVYKAKFSESNLIKQMENKGLDAIFMFKHLRHLLLLSLLNVPHELLRDRYNAFFASQLDRRTLWPKIFSQEYLPTPADTASWMTSFSDCLETLWRVNRAGYSIPEVDASTAIKLWIPKLRSLYKTSPNNNHLLKAVLRIIQVLSDYGLWRLNQKQYIAEFSYVLSSIPNLKDATLLGDAIDAIYILSGDEQPKIQRLIAHARFNLATLLFGKGTNFEIDPHKTRQAISIFRGFIEHGYLNDIKVGFAQVVPLDTYVSKLQILGFRKIPYIPGVAQPVEPVKKDEL